MLINNLINVNGEVIISPNEYAGALENADLLSVSLTILKVSIKLKTKYDAKTTTTNPIKT